jgi:monoamine oxidase
MAVSCWSPLARTRSGCAQAMTGRSTARSGSGCRPVWRSWPFTGHDWWRDEYSRGTWSVFRPGQLTVLPALQARHGRVVFAGSDVADGWNGFMDGAVESGLRAARSVTQLLQPARAPATAQ